MIARSVCLAVFALVSIACATPAQADWGAGICRSVVRDVKRRQCWPKPFVCPDRHSVRAPFALMVSNGWRQQNMLCDHHFAEKGGELTEAGRLKVRWILTEVPLQHRTIYVHRALSPEETAARIDHVRQFAAGIAPHEVPAAVLETSIPAQGWSAEQADLVGRKFRGAIPDPTLPPYSSTDEGSQ